MRSELEHGRELHDVDEREAERDEVVKGPKAHLRELRCHQRGREGAKPVEGVQHCEASRYAILVTRDEAVGGGELRSQPCGYGEQGWSRRRFM